MLLTWLLAAGLIAAAECDRRTGRLPNRLTLPLLLIAALQAWSSPAAALAALVLTAPYLAGFLTRSCGGGDVKLAPSCGVLAGSSFAALAVLLLAAVLTVAVCALVRRRRVVHGPLLVAATLVVAVAAA
ncbi:A24 family peptidase [Gordonia sp. PP30]|uniref:A24 family peptidase n=1 Tax=Gordonia sp. PP30 TaxID=2935861 RepID=UPI001FFF2A88|nr:A24 family peptidase [Gordonia sp. PP30]UQE73221.1 A24 family peptidase [Gordonia sp. PP30]